MHDICYRDRMGEIQDRRSSPTTAGGCPEKACERSDLLERPTEEARRGVFAKAEYGRPRMA